MMAKINSFFQRKQTLSDNEIKAALNKIRAEYNKYIVTFYKSAALKEEFEYRYRNACIESRDIEIFLKEEIVVVKSLFAHQNDLRKEKMAAEEKQRLNDARKSQPDFADRVLEKLKKKMLVYPPLKIHQEASYEIEHLYGAINQFEKRYWPQIDRFIQENRNWALRGEKRDFNNELWRFTPSGEDGIPVILEKYCLLLNSQAATLKEISFEAQQCMKEAAFLLNDILWSCKEIASKGIDNSYIEKSLNFVQNVINDFRIKDLKTR